MLVVGILLFDDVEVLDYCGPFEVFSSANTVGKELFRVHLISNSQTSVRTVGGMRVLPDITAYDDCPKLDILLVPGGVGTRKLVNDTSTLQFVQRMARGSAPATPIVSSVCTGSLVLGAAHILDGKTATTHWELFDLLEESCPKCMVDRTKHWVVDGNVWTSAGISAGIDMSLRLVEHCYDSATAREVAKYMEYTYPENNDRRI